MNLDVSMCLNQDAIMANRPTQQALVPGRCVLLADAASGMSELAAILGEPPAASPSRAAPASGTAHQQPLVSSLQLASLPSSNYMS